MNLSDIISHFCKMARIDPAFYSEAHGLFVKGAMQKVEPILRQGVNRSDMRISMFVASIANLNWQNTLEHEEDIITANTLVQGYARICLDSGMIKTNPYAEAKT